MYSLLLKHNSYLLVAWGGGGQLPPTSWDRFDGAVVATVDENLMLALFEAPKDEDPVVVVVVFLPMLEHPSNSELQCAKPLTKPQNWATNAEDDTLPSKNNTNYKIITLKLRDFSLFRLQGRWI